MCLELPASHRKRNVWEPLRLEQNPQVIWEPAVRNLEVDSVALARDVDAVCHHWDLRTLDLQGGCTEEVIVMTCFTYSKKERYIGKLNFFWMVQDEKKGEMILDTLQQSKIWGKNKTKQNSKTSNKTTKRTQLLGIVPWPLKTSKKKKKSLHVNQKLKRKTNKPSKQNKAKKDLSARIEKWLTSQYKVSLSSGSKPFASSNKKSLRMNFLKPQSFPWTNLYARWLSGKKRRQYLKKIIIIIKQLYIHNSFLPIHNWILTSRNNYHFKPNPFSRTNTHP